MADYEFVGTLISGRHYNMELGRTFETGDEVPLTAENVTNYGGKFSNIRKAAPVEVEPTKTTSKRKSSGKK